MGCMYSVTQEDMASANVDKQLAAAGEAERFHIKILLLGAGESGKSTVLKQVKIIHKGRLDDEASAKQCTVAIRNNCVECMQSVLNAMRVFNVPLQLDGNAARMERFLKYGDEKSFTPDMAEDVVELWRDPGVKEAYDLQSQYWLPDAASYYFDHALRLGLDDYIPTDEDIIMTRIRTTGIDTTEFSDPPCTYSVVDVGGQRNERRKWIHCFDKVKGVVFLVGLNGYNQQLFEDRGVNKMRESLLLFEQVVSNPIFKNTHFFLFLNKKDIFESMIAKTPLTVCFPNFTGPPNDVHAALEYVQSEYVALMEKAVPGKTLHVHVVAARVRMDMKVAWGDVKNQLKKAACEGRTRHGSKLQLLVGSGKS